jgi:hypothetical protein
MNPDIEAFPRAVPAGRTALVRLRAPHGHPALAPKQRRIVRFYSKVNRTEDSRTQVRIGTRGVLRLRLPFTTAGEYVLDVIGPGKEEKLLASERFFALKPEWVSLRPYKGDLHLHTYGSDGRMSRLAAALRGREVGMDFIAITDHDRYEPSVLAREEARAAGLDLLLIPGEEVTIRERGGHILALNASGPVGSERFRRRSYAERRRYVTELSARELVKPLTAKQYSHGVWTIGKIRQLGGLALIAHPFWEAQNKYYPPRAMCEQLMRDGLCDGFEVMGGSPGVEGNRLAVALYCEQALRGRLWPVIGGSDAHGAAGVGRHFTILFAPKLSAQDVVRSLREFRSVACDAGVGPDGAIYGPLDFVEYAYYLQREFFPLHDRICAAQAAVCREGLREARAVDSAAARRLRDALQAIYRDFWTQ